jgi:hypothetical protein
MTTVLGEELRVTAKTPTREVAISRRYPRRDRLARAVVVVAVYAMLMGLWSILWVPSVPVH